MLGSHERTEQHPSPPLVVVVAVEVLPLLPRVDVPGRDPVAEGHFLVVLGVAVVVLGAAVGGERVGGEEEAAAAEAAGAQLEVLVGEARHFRLFLVCEIRVRFSYRWSPYRLVLLSVVCGSHILFQFIRETSS